MLPISRGQLLLFIVLNLLLTSERGISQEKPSFVSPEVLTSEHVDSLIRRNRSEIAWATTCQNKLEFSQLKRVVRAKDWLKATKIAEDLIERSPKTGIGQYWLGVINLKQYKFIEAVHDFEAAVDLAPTDPRVHLDLGIAYLMINQFELFKDQMLWLTTNAPRDSLPFYYLGRYYSKRFDDPQGKAILFFQEALARNPRDYKSEYYLGYIYELKGRIETAKKEYESAWHEALSQNVAYSLPLQGMARLCLLENRMGEGLKYAERAISEDPSQSQNYLILGKLYLAENDYSKSITALNKASELDRVNPTPHYLLARAYRESGQITAAVKEIDLFEKIKRAYRSE